MVQDVQAKVIELQSAPLPAKLSTDCTVAIVVYTHDLNIGSKQGNLYYELNCSLRSRALHARESLLKVWGGYMFYMMAAFRQLPDIKATCWRGYNHGTVADILEQYKLGRMIQWGAFSSVTTTLAAAKLFAPRTHVVFKIAVTSGRDIQPYSFFPQESEILLSPNHRFTVSSEPRDEEGYTIIDLVQIEGSTFVS